MGVRFFKRSVQAPAYALYRKTTLGVALMQALADMVANGTLEKSHAHACMNQFDKSMNATLEDEKTLKTQINFSAHLHTYRNCDTVWTFVLEDVKFQSDSPPPTDKVKIVACEVRSKKRRR